MALKEAIRRSLSDLKTREEEKSRLELEMGLAFQEDCRKMDAQRASKTTTPSAPVENSEDLPEDTDAKPAAIPKAKVSKLAAPKKKAPTSKKAPHKTAKPVLMEEVKVEPPVKTVSPPSTPTKMSDTSFEDEAEGNGDIAKLVGSTLDKFAAAIDDFNSEFDRALNEAELEEKEIVVESTQGTEIVVESTKGTEIVEADDASDDELSQGSWVVDDEQFVNDEALARAAHVIGSALFQSDMIQSVQSAGNVSTLSQSENGSKASSNSSDGPSLAPSAMSVPTNPGSVTHYQMDRWAIQLNELHGMGLDDDSKIIEILERLTAANMGSDCEDEVAIERVVDEYYK